MAVVGAIVAVIALGGCSGGDASTTGSDSMAFQAKGGLRSGPQTPKGSLPKVDPSGNGAAQGSPP